MAAFNPIHKMQRRIIEILKTLYNNKSEGNDYAFFILPFIDHARP